MRATASACAPPSVCLPAGRERARQAQRSLALLRREVDVARAEREAVGVANRRHHAYLELERQVVRHALDDGHLLGVLLAEVGAVGADDREELEADGRHRPEVARPGRSLHALRHVLDLDPRLEPLRIHLLGGGGEDEVGADIRRERDVSVEVARVRVAGPRPRRTGSG